MERLKILPLAIIVIELAIFLIQFLGMSADTKMQQFFEHDQYHMPPLVLPSANDSTSRPSVLYAYR